MHREKCDSSTIRSFGYDPQEKLLEVEFPRGRVCRYRGVSPEEFAAFQSSESKGKFFYHAIRQHYQPEEA